MNVVSPMFAVAITASMLVLVLMIVFRRKRDPVDIGRSDVDSRPRAPGRDAQTVLREVNKLLKEEQQVLDNLMGADAIIKSHLSERYHLVRTGFCGGQNHTNDQHIPCGESFSEMMKELNDGSSL